MSDTGPDVKDTIEALRLATLIILPLVMFVSIAGNVSILVFTIKMKASKGSIRLLITNIACCNLLVTLVPSVMFLTDSALTFWPFGEIACQITLTTTQIVFGVSILSLLGTSIQQFISVIRPFDASRITNKKAIIYIVCCWFFVILTNICYTILQPMFVYSDVENRHVCRDDWITGHMEDEAVTYFIVGFALLVGIPSLSMDILYLATGIALWRQKPPGVVMETNQIASQKHHRDKSKKKKIIKMLLCVKIFFEVCWLPLWIRNILAFAVEKRWFSVSLDTMYIVNYTALYLVYSHGAVNPWLYPVFNERYREAYKDIFTNINSCLKTVRNKTFETQHLEEGKSLENKQLNQAKGIPLKKMSESMATSVENLSVSSTKL